MKSSVIKQEKIGALFIAEEIKEFKNLYYKRFKENITDLQVIDYMNRYLEIFKIIMKK